MGCRRRTCELPEARVIEQDQHDIRRTLRSLHRLRKLRLIRVEVGATDVAREVEIRTRQHQRSTRLFGLRIGLLRFHRRVLSMADWFRRFSIFGGIYVRSILSSTQRAALLPLHCCCNCFVRLIDLLQFFSFQICRRDVDPNLVKSSCKSTTQQPRSHPCVDT